jgi:hypothetical protein
MINLEFQVRRDQATCNGPRPIQQNTQVNHNSKGTEDAFSLGEEFMDLFLGGIKGTWIGNKRRRFNDRDEDEPQQEEKPDEKLKNATTLYVGRFVPRWYKRNLDWSVKAIALV